MSVTIEPGIAAKGKITIAIIAGQLVVGGAEQQLYFWLANMDRDHYNPIVITLHPGHGDYWEGPIEELKIPLIRIPQRNNRILRVYKLIQALRPHKPKLIHGWHLFASAYAGLAAKALGAKSIGGIRNTYQTFKTHKLESKLTLLTIHALVANSNSAAQQLVKDIHPQRQQVFAVQNAIDPHFIPRESIRKRLVQDFHLPPEALWIGSIGRMEPLKHFDWLLQVMSRLWDTRKNIHLLLIGDGPERHRLENLADSLCLRGAVTFTGAVPLASTWLQALDIFAFPSIDEGMPNVILEAAAAGLPIVTWQLPFYEELVVNHETALLINPTDLDEMVSALLYLIDSPQIRASLGQAAQSHVSEVFSLNRFICKMNRVYEHVLREKI